MTATQCFGQKNAAIAQPDTLLAYTGVINVDGVPKDELYIRARDWMGSNLQGLQIQDKLTGELSAKGVTEGNVTFRFFGSHIANATFSFTANIWVKDGKYMYYITNVNNTAITYDNSTVTAKDDNASAVGLLYTAKTAKGKILGLNQTRSDEIYQSAKTEFDKIEADMVASLTAGMQGSTTPDF